MFVLTLFIVICLGNNQESPILATYQIHLELYINKLFKNYILNFQFEMVYFQPYLNLKILLKFIMGQSLWMNSITNSMSWLFAMSHPFYLSPVLFHEYKKKIPDDIYFKVWKMTSCSTRIIIKTNPALKPHLMYDCAAILEI